MGNLPSYNNGGPPFRFGTLRMSDRADLVTRSGSQADGYAFVQANLFQLSALGANLDLEGDWPPLEGSDLAQWRQITTSGRDQYVRIVDYGYMFPFGNRAVIVQITDRVFSPDLVNGSDYADAYLQYYTFIRVMEPTKLFPAYGQPYAGNNWPFKSAEFLNLTTPKLDSNTSEANQGLAGIQEVGSGDFPQVFWPTVNGSNFLWKIHLVDYAGTTVSVHIPVAFCYASDSGDYKSHPQDAPYPLNQFSASDMKKLVEYYNGLGVSGSPSTNSQAPVAGTQILLAPEVTFNNTRRRGVTTHPTLQLTLGAATPSLVQYLAESATLDTLSPTAGASTSQLASANQPAFYPTVLSANIKLQAAETLTRTSLDDESGPGGLALGYYPGYIQVGFPSSLKPSDLEHPAFQDPATEKAHDRPATTPPPNNGSVYGSFLSPPTANFPSNMVGGVGNPNLNLNGLSAAAGAIGGELDQYSQEAMAFVTDYFGGLQSAFSSFLGGLPLGIPQSGPGGLIEGEGGHETPPLPPGILDPSGFANDLQVPQLTQSYDQATKTKTITYTMPVKLDTYPSDETAIFTPVADDGGMLTLTATVTVSPSGMTYDVTGTMDPFTINILGGSSAFSIILIPFGDDTQPGLTFQASNGAKTSISPNVGQVQFEGVLSFVSTLEQFLQDLGGSGLSIDVTPTQVQVSLQIALPNVGFGVFSLQNLALSAGVTVPFLGSPTVATFGFCSQDQPFTLTVMCFGGGGFVNFGVGLTSIQSVTASLDFEGQFALDLAVASGSVSLTAGIIFAYSSTNGASLTGFVRVNGEVSVLGILSVSITLEMQITYNFPPVNTISGTATLTVSISLFCFSVSVGITVTKTFSCDPSQGLIEKGHDVTGGLSPHDDPLLNPFRNSAPTFQDLMAPPDGSDTALAQQTWSDYCSAFGA